MTNKSLEFIKQHEGEFVEEPFLQQLEGLGWDEVIRLKMHTQTAGESYRVDFNEVLLLTVLHESLLKLNSWLEDEQIEDIIRTIKDQSKGKSLIENNQAFLNLLLEKTVSVQNRKTGSSETVRIIDFDNPENNRFIAIS